MFKTGIPAQSWRMSAEIPVKYLKDFFVTIKLAYNPDGTAEQKGTLCEFVETIVERIFL